MIADLIQQSKRFGHKAGEYWVMMMHDQRDLEEMGYKLHDSLQAYKENLEAIHVQLCSATFNNQAEDEIPLDQCIAWIRGEIKELENL